MRHSANRRHALRFARGGVFGSERDLSVFLSRAKGPVKDQFLIRLAVAFPDFAAKLGDGVQFQLEEVHAPASESDLRELEKSLGLPLPESYKSLLRCAREFWLLGGLVKFRRPFFHRFDPLDRLTPQQRRTVQLKGGSWPPPSQGMLCFADFFMEADGDQVLFDVSEGLIDGEYPVMYYAHEAAPADVRRLANTFGEFMAAFLDYPA